MISFTHNVWIFSANRISQSVGGFSIITQHGHRNQRSVTAYHVTVQCTHEIPRLNIDSTHMRDHHKLPLCPLPHTDRSDSPSCHCFTHILSPLIALQLLWRSRPHICISPHREGTDHRSPSASLTGWLFLTFLTRGKTSDRCTFVWKINLPIIAHCVHQTLIQWVIELINLDKSDPHSTASPPSFPYHATRHSRQCIKKSRV